MILQKGKILFEGFGNQAELELNCWIEGKWKGLKLLEGDGAFRASDYGIDARLDIKEEGEDYAYSLRFSSRAPTRIQLRIALPGAQEPFHVIPGCFYGDNNKQYSLGFGPVLSDGHPGVELCSPYWEIRADRSSLPLSMLYAKGILIGVSIDPYSDGKPEVAEFPEDFIRNGIFAEVAHNGVTDFISGNPSDACGVTLGHAEIPCETWSRKVSEPHVSRGAKAGGRIYLRQANSRLAVHDIVRHEYYFHRRTSNPPISRKKAVESLVDAFLRVNWHDENGINAIGTKPPKMTPFFGGGEIRENFTNMRCNDAEKKVLTAWRTLAEIGWTGGGVIGYPLLIAGHILGNKLAVDRANEMLDRVADSYNPASGLLWDVSGKHEGKRVNWWYSGYMVQDCHCAYTNGSGIWYLLRSYHYAKTRMGEERSSWLATACKALDTMVELQLPDGNYGYTYAVDRKEIIDTAGFAGVWFSAGMAMAYFLTKNSKYLVSAVKGAEYYHNLTANLTSWGTPMDQHKWPDEEGNLGLICACTVLHCITGEKRYIEMLRDACNYEYLWRYGQKTRPQFYPLKDSHWNSCGGSMTGVCSGNHPMGMIVNVDLLYLYKKTGDEYHLHRAQDGINWGVNSVTMYPEITGYGMRGVMTECWCPSNSRPGEFNADGTPSSIWHSYNGWASGATLEGLIDTIEEEI